MATKNGPKRVNLESSRLEEEQYDQMVVVKRIYAAEENIGDYSMWLDRLVSEIDQQNQSSILDSTSCSKEIADLTSSRRNVGRGDWPK